MKNDWLAAALLWLVTFLVLAAGASQLGFYADDAGWLQSLPHIHSRNQLWTTVRNYMPGRNLHPFWHYLTYQLVGGDPLSHLPALHRLQSALDALVVAAFYLVMRSARLPAAAAWLAAAGFAFWPIHGETHFWLESLPMNLLSTLFVLIFAATSLALARGPRRWWIWTVDTAAFAGALFTYDQAFPVLLLLVLLRAFPIGPWLHLPHLAAFGFCAWLRLSRGGGPMPRAQGVFDNIAHTFRENFGDAARLHVTPLLTNATATDWLAAAALAVLFGAGTLLLARPENVSSPRRQIFVVGILFMLAAYGPVWLWYASPRHEYLPSVGMFAALGAALAWLFDRLRRPATRVLLVATLSAGIALGVAANRGESRFWETAFTAKRQLFHELRQDLAGKETIVLQGFPFNLGTAFLIAPHDADHGARLVLRDAVGSGLRGFLGSAPAPTGRFLATHPNDGQNNFRYSTASNVLVVRFDSWRDGRLVYQKDPAPVLPYDVVSTECAAAPQISTKREGDDVVTTLGFAATIPTDSHLAAIVNFWHWDRFEGWSGGQPPGNASPILLSPGCFQTLRLRHFPQSSRLQLDFYQVSAASPPALLGRFETKVQP